MTDGKICSKDSKKCPRCGSGHIEIEGDDFFSYVACMDCGFDESLEYEANPNERVAKGGGGSPYKRGGALRIQKRNN